MIDVTFLLLIFFMCTLKFKVLERKLEAYLPEGVGVSSGFGNHLEKVGIRIEVAMPGTKLRWNGANGQAVPYTAGDAALGRRFFFGADRALDYTVGGRATADLAEVTKRLKWLKDADPEIKAIVNAREGSIQKDVVQVLDAALEAGFDDIMFRGSGHN